MRTATAMRLLMCSFIVLIFSGFVYIWKKGALDWSRNEPNVALGTSPHTAAESK